MDFRRVETVDEVLHVLADRSDEARILAGGTDVMVQYQRGEISPGVLVHIEPIEALRAVDLNGQTTLGPLVTHRTLGTDPGLTARHPALAAAARTVGGWQTQAVGTVGGNICNASPAADTVPPLLVANAHVTVVSERDERRLPLAAFILGRRQTALAPDEIVSRIDLEPVPDGAGETYLKLGRRGAMEVALVGLAVRLGFDPDGAVTGARVAMCSVAPVPARVPDAEAALLGSRLEKAALDAAAKAMRAAASPIDDARASAAYRLRTLRGLLERAVTACREQAT